MNWPRLCSSTRDWTSERVEQETERQRAALRAHLPREGGRLFIQSSKSPELTALLWACRLERVTWALVGQGYPAARLASALQIFQPHALWTSAGFEPLAVTADWDSLGIAYCLFTSGSQGVPKAVPIREESLIALETAVPFSWLHDSTPLLGLSEPGFDVGVLEMSLSFLGGRALAGLSAEETRNPLKAWPFLMELEPGMWSSTPTVLRMFLNHPRFDAAHLTRLKDFLLIGEAVTPDLVEKLRRRFPDATLWNGYGPTEASVIVTLEEIDLSTYLYPQEISIGRPLAHADVELVENEIWISGPALSPGYLGGVASAAFRADEENVWFASGDGAHRDDDGKFYYRERLTRELKVSGHRISLSEVEELILRQPGVTHAAVLPWPDADNARGLDAFVKCETPAMVASALTAFLPEPAVPRRFIEVREWPLNSNGKTCVTALTELATSRPEAGRPAPAKDRSHEPPERH